MQPQPIIQVLRRYSQNFHRVLAFRPGKDVLLKLDFTAAHKGLTNVINDTESFSEYIDSLLHKAHARYGIGGYNEHRTVYARSSHFDDAKEPRRLHLGTDVWGPVGTPIYAFMGGMVHSVAFNDNYGDYGATMILLHQLDGIPFYTLYGHISLEDIRRVTTGQYVVRGQEIAHFGRPSENGHWPPHLHFQVIIDMEGKHGDYPGVCKFSEREIYLNNCPDPDLILQMEEYAV